MYREKEWRKSGLLHVSQQTAPLDSAHVQEIAYNEKN